MKPRQKTDVINGPSAVARELLTSRQRVWQEMQRAEGRCVQCGKKASKSRCDVCAEKSSVSNFKTIARRLGKTRAAALFQELFCDQIGGAQ